MIAETPWSFLEKVSLFNVEPLCSVEREGFSAKCVDADMQRHEFCELELQEPSRHVLRLHHFAGDLWYSYPEITIKASFSVVVSLLRRDPKLWMGLSTFPVKFELQANTSVGVDHSMALFNFLAQRCPSNRNEVCLWFRAEVTFKWKLLGHDGDQWDWIRRYRLVLCKGRDIGLYEDWRGASGTRIANFLGNQSEISVWKWPTAGQNLQALKI